LIIVYNYIKKIELEHQKSLYKCKKNKKIINDKDIIYNITPNITSQISNESMKIKEYNIKIINNIPDMKKDLILGIKPNQVYKDTIFEKILKNNNYYDTFKEYKNTYKLTYNSKMYGYTKIKEAINNKTYINYKHIYSSNSEQYKKITESPKSIIVIINSRQNEIYLLHYNKDT
jgi:hypothetical protein